MGRKNSIKQPWTTEEVATLKRLAEEHHPSEIAPIMGRPVSAVRGKIAALGIKCKHAPQWGKWTEKEERFLEENHSTMTAQQMADSLGRTLAATQKKCFYMGLDCRTYSPDNRKAKYSDDDVRLCRALFSEGLSRRVIAEKMEVPYQRVCEWVNLRTRKRG